MTVARTARRRRKQAVNRFRHLARIGRGNNNRTIYSMHSVETYEKRAAAARERRLNMAARRGSKGRKS